MPGVYVGPYCVCSIGAAVKPGEKDANLAWVDNL